MWMSAGAVGDLELDRRVVVSGHLSLEAFEAEAELKAISPVGEVKVGEVARAAQKMIAILYIHIWRALSRGDVIAAASLSHGLSRYHGRLRYAGEAKLGFRMRMLSNNNNNNSACLKP